MSQSLTQELRKTLVSRIDTLEEALAQDVKQTRYADGTYVEFRSVQEIKDQIFYFQQKLRALDGTTQSTRAVQVVLNRGI